MLSSPPPLIVCTYDRRKPSRSWTRTTSSGAWKTETRWRRRQLCLPVVVVPPRCSSPTFMFVSGRYLFPMDPLPPGPPRGRVGDRRLNNNNDNNMIIMIVVVVVVVVIIVIIVNIIMIIIMIIVIPPARSSTWPTPGAARSCGTRSDPRPGPAPGWLPPGQPAPYAGVL